ncbi:MAG: hypothetical protein JNM41_00330 [Flavipsychrobacter sp.]|nr:hypothetical protein [Flavipsychrobacter sp.]
MRTFFVCILLCAVNFSGFSQDPVVRKKTFSKSFSCGSDHLLFLQNACGNIFVDTWDKNEVKVDVEMTTYAKDNAEADDLLKYSAVTDEMIEGSKTLFLHTHTISGATMAEKQDTIYTTLNTVYRLFIPRNMPVNIQNTYGNVYLGDMGGTVNVRVVNGSLHAQRIGGSNNNIDIDMGIGKSTIGQVRSASFSGYNSDIAIKNALDVSIKDCGNVEIANGKNVSIFKTSGFLKIDTADGLSGRIAKTSIAIAAISGNSDIELRNCENVNLGTIVCRQGELVKIAATNSRLSAMLGAENYNLRILPKQSKVLGNGVPGNLKVYDVPTRSAGSENLMKKGSKGTGGGYVFFELGSSELELK